MLVIARQVGLHARAHPVAGAVEDRGDELFEGFHAARLRSMMLAPHL